ncbi:MAG: ABC transporter permease [Terracidiphilus sp.]
MKWFPSFGFQRRKRELQQEIDAHLQMAIADRVARGETAETARQAAMREFGNIPLVQDVTRQMWGRGSLEQLGRDLGYALRQLRKSPGFTITATAMLAVAICANSTIFSWIDGTMLRPIPGARDMGELVSLQRGERNFSPTPPFSYLDYRDLREQNRTLTGILAYHNDWIALTGGAQPERVYIANVSANYFDVLGIKPVVGRFFLPDEESRAVPTVILGYSLWKTRYAKDPAIVGKSIEVSRHPLTVIGVAPEGFIGAAPGLRDDLWVTLDPLGTDVWRMTHRDSDWLIVIGRLRPGVSRDQASQDLDTGMHHLVVAYPDQHLGDNHITLDPMWRSPFGANGYMAATLPLLLAFAGLVLLLTSANVATLTLVRFVSRRRELAIRQSLGANRMQLVRQMMLEGALLSVVAGAVALLLTSWTSKTFAWFFPANSIPLVLNGNMDHKVVIGIAVFSLLAGMLCGALPAWRSSHAPAIEVLKAESASISGGSRNRKLLSGLVVAQIALSLPLLLCSGLFLRTLRNLAAANPGFEQDHVLTASVGLNIAGYSNDEAQSIRRKILDRVSVLPGVKVASLTDWIPMTLIQKRNDAYPEGYVPPPHESLLVENAEVGPQYFESLHIPILEGREFTLNDDEKAPRVIIVDQTAARRFWPGQDPVGKRLRVWGSLFTVVGVVRNSTHTFVNESPEPMVYMSFFQAGYETIVQVKTEGNPLDLASAVEQAIHGIDSRLPVFDVRSMRESTQLASTFAVIESSLAGMFALIGLVLAVTGIYGVVAYRTQMRTHEIGIRMALGASRVDVLRLVLLQGLWITGIGLALGLAFALGLTRVIARLLYGIGANDPVTVASVVLLLGAMSLVASYFPAHRAMRRNPVTAIREL